MEQVTIKIGGKVMTKEQWIEEMVAPAEAAIVGIPKAELAGWVPPEVP